MLLPCHLPLYLYNTLTRWYFKRTDWCYVTLRPSTLLVQLKATDFRCIDLSDLTMLTALLLYNASVLYQLGTVEINIFSIGFGSNNANGSITV